MIMSSTLQVITEVTRLTIHKEGFEVFLALLPQAHLP